jgi:predicted nucleic acid-binding protein
MNAVDTNVLVYSFDQFEPAKRTKARDLLTRLGQSSAPPRLLWQVAGELLSCLARWESTGRLKPGETITYLNHVVGLMPLVLPTAAILGRAIEMRGRHSLSHWDSMLLAACIEAGIDTLYSEDLSAGTTYDTVRVVNPFA